MTSKAFGLAQLGNVYSDGSLSSRNKVINGAMVIDQRNAGAAVTGSGDGLFAVDRTRFRNTGVTGSYTVQRSTVAPTEFRNSLSALVVTPSLAGASASRTTPLSPSTPPTRTTKPILSGWPKETFRYLLTQARATSNIPLN